MAGESEDRMQFRVGLCITLMLLMTGAPLLSGTTICGDANGDGAINLGDAVFLITYAFRAGPAPDPLGKADVNYDGQVNVGDVVWLVRYAFLGDFPPVCPPFVGTSWNSGCKSFADKSDTTTEDCISWTYDGQSVLSIHHINAAFNCCPGELSFDIDVAGGIITVTEIEDDQGCDCICLFDVDYDIVGILPGEYTIVIVEPYVIPGLADPLEFAVDLNAAGSGLFCVPRDHYPWGMDAAAGDVIGHSACKVTKDGSDDWIECLTWSYDGQTGVLNLQHVNATANCCIDSIYADFAIGTGAIDITEYEDLDGGGCWCVCPYDVDYEFVNIPVGEVTISLIAVYGTPETALEVTIDLVTEPEGRYCWE